jgi:hypothetical protein
MINGTYGWLLHYNPYTQLWNMFHRDDIEAYWGGKEFKHPLIKSKNSKTLEDILMKTKGLEEEIIKLLKELEIK